MRDVGGHATRTGARIRTGSVYRSTALHRLDGDDAIAFAELGIRTVYDLRTPGERASEPDRLPPGTVYVPADVIGDVRLGSPAHLDAMLVDPAAALEALGDGRGLAMWTRHYRDFVLLDSARAAYERLFAGIAVEGRRPALFHCTSGKDRTGWAAAALLLLLDVPYDVVMEDFLRSGEYLQPILQPMFERFEARGGDPELLRPIMGVAPAYLDAARDEVERSYGSIERYFTDGLRIDVRTQAALRDALVERD